MAGLHAILYYIDKTILTLIDESTNERLEILARGVGGGGTPYNGLYGEAPPERDTFSRFRYMKG